jgi:hypothetical protein
VTFEASDFYEKSPNDKTDTATPIAFLDKPYTGNLSSDSDKDFYKFTLSTAGNVTFTLAQDNPSPLKSGDWKATVYQDGNFSDPGLLFFSLKGEVESNSVTKELVAGDYYLKISRPDYFYSSDQYHITVSTGTATEAVDESSAEETSVTTDNAGDNESSQAVSNDDEASVSSYEPQPTYRTLSVGNVTVYGDALEYVPGGHTFFQPTLSKAGGNKILSFSGELHVDTENNMIKTVGEGDLTALSIKTSDTEENLLVYHGGFTINATENPPVLIMAF